MNNEILLYSAVMLISVFISAIAQVLLKKAALEPHESRLKEYLNPKVMTGYIIFFLATVLTVFAYKAVPLSLGVILESTGYIYIMVFGLLIFKEKMNLKKIIALVLIISGVILFQTGV
ncbi:MAG: EamA family transporter [Lachnospiraceae bacterium]|nr:EamA family transporter [Lachnospiraceae bacterium]